MTGEVNADGYIPLEAGRNLGLGRSTHTHTHTHTHTLRKVADFVANNTRPDTHT